MQTIETRRLVFPDTTVLVNFALVNEMSLLERLVGGNGRWCDTVASECQDQSKKQGLPQMRRADDISGLSRVIKSLVVADDKAVPQRLADLDLHPTIQSTTSWHLFRVAHWKGYINRERFGEIRRVLLAHGRGCPDDVRDPAKFAVWITPPS
ncbi:hypothetical protein [uncultured Tessaracoccus sp.]|uniref:hypothetical protein n=1 Tax=uncultured Tessaracoccus sp. TaxID=905023 RepID=UPI00261FD238|nr:hypothetical protein [uncultured Tessaracoccus sp.]